MSQKTSNLIILSVAILLVTLIIIPSSYYSDAYIPPTRAFQKIWVGSNNLTADTYNSNLTITPGTNVAIQTFFANNTLRFSASTSSGPLEGLTNVTSWGCGVGQVRAVNSGKMWECSSAGAGDITGAANVGGATGNIFRDEAAGILNFKTISGTGAIIVTNNADTIDISMSGGSGFTSMVNLAGGNAKIIYTNSSNKATFKSFTAGSGISLTNGTGTITITATGGGGNATSLKDLGDVAQSINATKGNVFAANGTHWNGIKVGSDGQVLTADSSKTFGVKWATASGTGNATSLNDLAYVSNVNQTKGNLFFANGSNWTGLKVGPNGYGLVADSARTTGYKWVLSGNASSLKQLGDVDDALNQTKGNVFMSNGTHYDGVKVGSNGQVLTADSTKQFGVTWSTVTASGGATSLGSNLTSSSPGTGAYTNIFTIPLTANSGNTISAVIDASTNTAGSAVQVAVNTTATGNVGWCLFSTPITATTEALDFIRVNGTSRNAQDTGETTWLPAINDPQPIIIDCTIKSGPTAGNAKIWFQPEVASTVKVYAGSYYIKTP